MTFDSYKLSNLPAVNRVSTAVDDDRLCDGNMRAVFVFEIDLDLVLGDCRIGVDFTDVDPAVRCRLERARERKSCDGIETTTFGTISTINFPSG